MAPEVIMQEYGALADEWSVGKLPERHSPFGHLKQ